MMDSLDFYSASLVDLCSNFHKNSSRAIECETSQDFINRHILFSDSADLESHAIFAWLLSPFTNANFVINSIYIHKSAFFSFHNKIREKRRNYFIVNIFYRCKSFAMDWRDAYVVLIQVNVLCSIACIVGKTIARI